MLGRGSEGWADQKFAVFVMCSSVYNLTDVSRFPSEAKTTIISIFFSFISILHIKKSVSETLPQVSDRQDWDVNLGLCSLQAYTTGSLENMEPAGPFTETQGNRGPE